MRISLVSGAVNWRRIAPLLVIAAGVLAYSSSFSGAFLFDDTFRILENPAIQEWPAWDLLGSSFRPVADITFAANYRVGGLKAADYHAVNLVIHLIVGLTLYGLTRRTLVHVVGASRGSDADCFALISTVVWVCHPLTTGAVTYICQRYEILMSMFYVLTLYCVVRGAMDSQWEKWWYLGAVVACALGMGSKEVMVSAPLVVLVYDWVLLSRGSWRRILRQRWGLYVGLVACWVVLGALMRLRHDVAGTNAYVWRGMTSVSYLATEFGVVCRYVQLAIWPAGLCFDYGWPEAETAKSIVLPAIPVILLGAGSAVGVYRRKPEGFVGAWFILILAPTSSLVPRPDPIAEHRMYLALAGVLAALVSGAWWIRHRILAVLEHEGARRWISRGTVGVICLVWTALTVTTVKRNEVYRSAERMWGDVTAKRPANVRAHLNLTCELLGHGRLQEAEVQTRKVLAMLPDFSGISREVVPSVARGPSEARLFREVRYFAHAQNYAGVVCARRGLTTKAVEHFREALRLLPQFADARRNLSLALSSAGESTVREDK